MFLRKKLGVALNSVYISKMMNGEGPVYIVTQDVHCTNLGSVSNSIV
jgi:hypothetical protein